MSGRTDKAEATRRREAAIAWHVRLQSDAATEADWRAFEAWLGEPGAQDAYDQIDRLWAAIDLDRDALAAALAGPDHPAARRPRPAVRQYSWYAFAAAAVLAAVAITAVLAPRHPAAPWTVYAAAKGEKRAVRLADGSSIELASKSSVRVSLGAHERRVVMGEAEAVFDVAKDPGRPFLITAGDNAVRVVGTRFDILNHDGRTVVTVARGVVEVRRAAAEPSAAPVRLIAGQQLVRRRDGGVEVNTVDPDSAFAWRSGRLIYRDAELSDVIADLNRYLAIPIRATPGAARLRFSGVLTVDREDAVVHRLEAFLPVTAKTDGGVVELRQRGER